MGTCGRCRVRFRTAPPAPSAAGRRRLPSADLADGWRLACQQHVIADALVEVAEAHAQLRTKATDPMRFPAAAPSLHRSACDERAGRLGLAVDVGTTTLAVYLFDVARGTMLASEAGYNPQRTVGADVIARIGYVRTHGDAGLTHLHRTVVEGLNGLIDRACRPSRIDPLHVGSVVVVGNPTMLHLLVGVSPVGIDQSPFTAAFLDSRMMIAREIGLLVHPEGEVHLLPGATSYVGADVLAGVLATSLGQDGRPELLVDVGTNGEIVLAAGGRLSACSTAAGPAFEGAAIHDGMNATRGAIEDLRIDGTDVRCTVLGDGPPAGICGTGLISIVEELLTAGLIDVTGKLVQEGRPLDARIRGTGRERRFDLTDGSSPIALYQEDIRAFQLGKAAIRSGIDTLLEEAGVSPTDLDRVYIAGAFGTHLLPERAIGTGLLPRMETERIVAAGNTAGQGAAMALLDDRTRRDLDDLARRIESVELAAIPEFSRRYIARMAFPRSNPPSATTGRSTTR